MKKVWQVCILINIKYMEKLILNFWGINVCINSNNDAFLDFTKRYFKGFELVTLVSEPVIDLVFNFEKGFRFKVDRKSESLDEFLGEKAGMQKGSYVFQYQEVDATIKFEDSLWSSEVRFKKNLFKHFANLLFFRGLDTQKHYYRFVVRLIIQNLIFMKIKQGQNKEVLSGAAISVNNEAYVFLGLPGAGKSTLIKQLMKDNPGAKILTENYVVISGDRVYFYTEGAGDNCLDSYLIKKLYIISRGAEAVIEKISPENAFSQIIAVNNYTAELPMHGPFAGYILYNPTFMFMLGNETLQKLLEIIPAYRARIDKDANKFMKLFFKKDE